MTKVAINGFGRIGRLVMRAALEGNRDDIEIVAVNDLADAKTNAMLFARDSVHGPFPGEVRAEGDELVVNGRRIRVTAEKDPARLPHGELGVDVAMECTGIFTKCEQARWHLQAGAKRVLISAPMTKAEADVDAMTVVYGVNHDRLTPAHLIVSNASCTTNCLAPVAKVMHETFGIADQVAMIANGRVVAQGTPDELRAQAGQDNLEDAFVRLIGSEEGLHA